MDVCVIDDTLESVSTTEFLEELGTAIENAGIPDVKILTRARVPIIKLKDPVT
jgi:DNA polymerase sigma